VIPAALYLRVSTTDQHVANQRPALEQMAAGRGYSISPAHVFTDEGVSGTKTKWERPGLRGLLQAAARGEIRAVLVWAYDRLSREDDSFYGGLLTVAGLQDHKCDVLSYSETYLEFAGPLREPLRLLVFQLAAEERKRGRARQDAGRARIAAQLATAGTFVSRKSGKVRASLGKPGQQVLMADAAGAHELRRQGLSYEAIRRRLAAKGSPDYDKRQIRRAVLRWGKGVDPKPAENRDQEKAVG
jgi:DNA invertase Pin-like site-specific DNA recombinase